MNEYWIAVADSGKARIFSRAKKFSKLEEIETLVHPESRLKGVDLVTDRPGQVHESHAYGESPNEATRPKELEAQRFAREIADRLERGRKKGEYRHLVLVAAPRFLGRLRNCLDAETREHVAAEVDKDLTRADGARIAAEVDEAY